MERRSIAITLALVLVLSATSFAAGKKAPDWNIGPEEAFEMVSAGEAVLVDVRVLGFYAHSHISGALNVPYGEIVSHARQFADQPKAIITYCDCPAEETSEAAAIELRDAGVDNVRVLKGGIRGWVSAGLPVRSGNRP